MEFEILVFHGVLKIGQKLSNGPTISSVRILKKIKLSGNVVNRPIGSGPKAYSLENYISAIIAENIFEFLAKFCQKSEKNTSDYGRNIISEAAGFWP